MKQYCRYCSACIDNGYNELYCTAYYPKDKWITYKHAKSVNHCKKYGYCGSDVITGKDHTIKQRKARKEKKADGEQIKMKGGTDV